MHDGDLGGRIDALGVGCGSLRQVDAVGWEWQVKFEADDGWALTAPVGSYPAGASPYGVLDLAGNVFEWTSTPFGAGEMTVKGSAWEDFGGVGRGASRHGRKIGARHVIVGFRCAGQAP